MQTEKQRERLVELLNEATFGVNTQTLADHLKKETIERVAEYLMANNVVVLPLVAYNKSHERYQVIHKGKDGRIFASKLYYTRKDAENTIKERKENDK